MLETPTVGCSLTSSGRERLAHRDRPVTDIETLEPEPRARATRGVLRAARYLAVEREQIESVEDMAKTVDEIIGTAIG